MRSKGMVKDLDNRAMMISLRPCPGAEQGMALLSHAKLKAS